MARAPKPTLLADLARSRIERIEPEPWVPTDEEKQSIARGDLIVIPLPNGTIHISLALASTR